MSLIACRIELPAAELAFHATIWKWSSCWSDILSGSVFGFRLRLDFLCLRIGLAQRAV